MRDKFKFSHKIKVRYNEVDAQNIVFNAHYLIYLDVAWLEYLRYHELEYKKLIETNEFDIVLAKTTLEYKSPAYYDDTLEVFVRVSELRNSSFTVDFLIYNENGILVLKAEIIYVTYFPQDRVTGPIPARIREIFATYEGIQG